MDEGSLPVAQDVVATIALGCSHTNTAKVRLTTVIPFLCIPAAGLSHLSSVQHKHRSSEFGGRW